MKNKKIITRVLTLLASVVLVFALTLPCFADEEQNVVYDSFIEQIPVEMNTPALEGLIYMTGVDIMEYDTVCSGYLSNGENLLGLGDNPDVSFFLQGDFVIGVGQSDTLFLQNHVVLISCSSVSMTVFIYEYLPSDDPVAFFTYGINARDGLTYAYLVEFGITGMSFSVEDASSVSIAYGLYNHYTNLHNNVPSVLFGSSDVLHPATYRTAYEQGSLSGGDSGDTVRSGMFGQLYNILKDAIFGSDVTLDNNQDFVLTQISTWLTYIVLLLPILVVAIILWRVFVR